MDQSELISLKSIDDAKNAIIEGLKYNVLNEPSNFQTSFTADKLGLPLSGSGKIYNLNDQYNTIVTVESKVKVRWYYSADGELRISNYEIEKFEVDSVVYVEDLAIAVIIKGSGKKVPVSEILREGGIETKQRDEKVLTVLMEQIGFEEIKKFDRRLSNALSVSLTELVSILIEVKNHKAVNLLPEKFNPEVFSELVSKIAQYWEKALKQFDKITSIPLNINNGDFLIIRNVIDGKVIILNCVGPAIIKNLETSDKHADESGQNYFSQVSQYNLKGLKQGYFTVEDIVESIPNQFEFYLCHSDNNDQLGLLLDIGKYLYLTEMRLINELIPLVPRFVLGWSSKFAHAIIINKHFYNQLIINQTRP